MNRFPLFLHTVLFLTGFSLSQAQTQSIISRVNIPAALESRPLAISVDLTQNTGILRVVIAYRRFGQSEFTEQEMLLAGRTATVTIPGETVAPPHLEYYVRVELEGNRTETYPLQNADGNPERIPVRGINPKDLEVRMLSPQTGETVALEDLVIAVSLFYTSDAVNREATRLYLDGVDVTAEAVLSEDILLYSPRNFPRPLNLGAHFIRVELRDTTGALYHTVERSFNLSTTLAIAEAQARVQLGLNGQLEYRNEDVGGLPTVTYARGDLRGTGTWGALNFGTTIHLDNQDKPERQPQNRYLIYGETSFLRLQYGDAYPRFPSLIVSGKRVRGLSANLALGFFNLDVSFGETKRAIEGIILRDTVFADSSAVNARPKTSVFKGPSFFEYTLFSQGTYRQNIVAVRPSFGSGDNFQLGFTYMKSKDDVGSIKYGILPTENLVVGTDLMFAFDDQRFKFETQASLALENKDISGGNFSESDYDSLFQDNQAGRDAAKLAENFITVNENLFPTNPVGTGLPGVALEANLTLNYINNYILAQFFRRGASYKSYGNEFVQTDIQGFSVSDRIRLFNNRVLLSIAYEQKADNTADTKTATTTFSNLNTSASINPGQGWPTFSIGYGSFGRLSDLDVRKLDIGIPDSASTERRKSADDVTTRIFFGSSYDFNLGVRHTFTLSINSSSREDRTFYRRDQTNLAVQTALASTFRIPLQTTVGFGINQNESFNQLFRANGADSTLTQTTFDFTSVVVGGQYRVLNDRMRIAAAVSPTFGDLTRTTIQFGVEYAVAVNHTFEFSLSYIQNKSPLKNDMITSLFYRFNF
ncbi:MAG TPA: hypothetical protein VNN76_03975 [Bacteroidota bacterium]|nr:hypothetical protein [Bacteroidota bacterium]